MRGMRKERWEMTEGVLEAFIWEAEEEPETVPVCSGQQEEIVMALAPEALRDE